MGLPHYMAAARVDDVERTVHLANELAGSADQHGPVCLIQCGRPAVEAPEIAQHLNRLGLRTSALVITDRLQAQSDSATGKVNVASAAWVFADDLLEAFSLLFATELCFILRSRSRQGLPVTGIGGGALALGSLLLANKICSQSHYQLVSGLGWAPRVLFDSSLKRQPADEAITRTTIRSLPGLLGVDLRASGGVRVLGDRVESVGSEPIRLFGAGNDAAVLSTELDPGRTMMIAPPPFAPFEQRLLSVATLASLAALADHLNESETPPDRPTPLLHQAPPPIAIPAVDGDQREDHTRPGSDRVCPMCKKFHAAEAKLELAA